MNMSKWLPQNTIAMKLQFNAAGSHFIYADAHGNTFVADIAAQTVSGPLGNGFKFSSPVTHLCVYEDQVIVTSWANQMMMMDWTQPEKEPVALPTLEDVVITCMSVSKVDASLWNNGEISSTGDITETPILFIAGTLPNGSNTISCYSFAEERFVSWLNTQLTATPMLAKRKGQIASLTLSSNVLYVASHRWVIPIPLPSFNDTVPAETSAHSFDNLMLFGVIKSDIDKVEAVAVERPWANVMDSVPPPVQLKLYGQ